MSAWIDQPPKNIPENSLSPHVHVKKETNDLYPIEVEQNVSCAALDLWFINMTLICVYHLRMPAFIHESLRKSCLTHTPNISMKFELGVAIIIDEKHRIRVFWEPMNMFSRGSATSQATTGKLLRKINVKCQPVQVRHVIQLYLLKRWMKKLIWKLGSLRHWCFIVKIPNFSKHFRLW